MNGSERLVCNASINDIVFASINDFIICSQLRLTMDAIQIPAASCRGGEDKPTINWRNIVASGILGNLNFVHGRETRVVGVNDRVLDSEDQPGCRFATRIYHADTEVNCVVSLERLSQLRSSERNPSPFGQFKGLFSLANAPNTYSDEQCCRDGTDQRSNRIGDVRIRDISPPINHRVQAALCLIIGVTFTMLSLMGHAPIALRTVRNAALRWTVSMCALALGLALMTIAFLNVLQSYSV